MRSSRLFVLLGVVALVAASSAWVAGQAVATQRVPPVMVSGENVGFLIEGNRGGTPIGRLMIRQDGKWVHAEVGRVNALDRLSAK